MPVVRAMRLRRRRAELPADLAECCGFGRMREMQQSMGLDGERAGLAAHLGAKPGDCAFFAAGPVKSSRALLGAARVEIGRRIGIDIPGTPQDRHAVTRKLGAFRTSMLQDMESNRKIELDALVGTVRDIARHVKVETPNIDALFGLTRLYARSLGLYD